MGKRTAKGAFTPKKGTSTFPITVQEKIEMGILRILMEDEKLMKMTEGKLELDDFSTTEHKEIFQLLSTGSGRGSTPARSLRVSPSSLLDKIENERTKLILSRIAAMDLGTAELSIQLADHLKTLNNLKKDKKIKLLKESIKRAEQQGDMETVNRLLKEHQKLKKN
jgi:hypothetical protein